MPRLPAAVLGLSLLLLAPALHAGLSAAEWQELQKTIEKEFGAIKDADYRGMAQYIPKLGADDSTRAIGAILKLAKACQYDAQVTAAAAQALCGLSDEGAVKQVHEKAKAADWREQIICIEALGLRQDGEAVDTLIKLAQKKGSDQVQASAIRELGRAGDPDAILPVIDVMSKLDKTKGVVWEMCKAALTKLVGAALDSGADYANYYEARKSDPDLRPTTGEKKEGITTIFGTPITCNKIVFIIDVSGSMKTTDPLPDDFTGTETDGDEAQHMKERQRILRAQKELCRVIDELASSVKFAIVAYSRRMQTWSGGGESRTQDPGLGDPTAGGKGKELSLAQADAGNKQAAKQFVNNFQPEGTTWTDAAVEEAFRFKDAYCFYLLSDGAPTHEGGEPPADTEQLQEAILKRAEELSRFHKVNIHTLGFKGAAVGFMEKLAEITGGSYRDIR